MSKTGRYQPEQLATLLGALVALSYLDSGGKSRTIAGFVSGADYEFITISCDYHTNPSSLGLMGYGVLVSQIEWITKNEGTLIEPQ